MADLKAFENLRETGKDSLSGAEKNALNAIKEGDLRAAKDEIGKKEFDIDGKKMSVQQIVENLKFSSDWKTAYLNGKPIATTSELGAALQVYAIANNKGIGGTKIDGWLGKNSNQGLSNVQQDLGIERKPAPKENSEGSSIDKMGIAELLSKPFKKYFDEGERKELYDKRVMDRNTYTLIPTNSSSYKFDKKLKFSYQFENKYLQIEVPITEDADGYVDAKKLADTIRDRINTARDNRTTEVDNSSADKGIDSFNEGAISNPVIRKWAQIKGVDFKSEVLSDGRIRVNAMSGKNNLAKFICNNSEVLTNRKFDANKFNNVLKDKCYTKAVADVEDNIKRMSNSYAQPSALTTVLSANAAVTLCRNLITQIDGFGDAKSFENVRKDIVDKQMNYQNQKDYLQEKTDMLNSISKIRKLAGTNNKSFVKNFDEIYKEMLNIVSIEKNRSVKYAYKVDYRTYGRTKFDKVGKADEYDKMVDGVINSWKSIREGGDEKYTLDIVK